MMNTVWLGELVLNMAVFFISPTWRVAKVCILKNINCYTGVPTFKKIPVHV